MTKANTSPSWPGVRCIFFVSQLLVHVAVIVSNANTHRGRPPYDKSVQMPHLDYSVKASDSVTSLSGGSEMSPYGVDASLRQ